ncbi:MAG: DUF362 domain-containing protein, partial [Myxococcota bacterium]|nr:DUF362 domain-containing protein [Myxococcota bacterium]
MSRPKVILRSCPDYDPERIRVLVREALDTLDLRPHGRTLVKPNVVASGEHFPHAYTRPEFIEGVLRGLRDRAEGMTELAVGERCGITIPTRFAFREAGYPELVRRVGDVKLYHFDEEQQVEIPLYHPERMRRSLFTPEPVAAADFFVNCPKFKAHPWTTVTFSMKNYIGIQDDRHRLIDHDHRLNPKVADLQYIVQPRFIAIDAIVAGEGRMLTPIPFDMGMVIMGDNQVAFDSVCCHMIGVDPMEVEHIRLAAERGFGPVDLEKIDIVGDVSMDEARERASGFRTGLIRVEDYFRGTSIRAYGGRPPGDAYDYCWGGCPGALEEAIEILRLFDKATDDKMPPLHVVFGRHEGPIDAREGEKVVFIGDCAEFHGDIAGQHVDVENIYQDRSGLDPREASYEGIYGKMARVTAGMWWNRKEQVIRMKGCPVSVAEQVLALVNLGGLRNPYMDPSQAIPFTSCYLSWRSRTILKRALGKPYNQRAPAIRGSG